MNRVNGSGVETLWDTSDSNRVEDIRSALINDVGDLKEPALASVANELLSRLGALSEQPTSTLPKPDLKGKSTPSAFEATRLVSSACEKLNASRVPDAAGQQRLEKMQKTLTQLMDLKTELLMRSESLK